MHEAPQTKLWASDENQEALVQLTDLCAKSLNLDVALSPGGKGFSGGKPDSSRRGIAAIAGSLLPDDIIVIEVLLACCSGSFAADVVELFKSLAELNGRVRLLPPRNQQEGTCLWAELQVAAIPMSFSRAGAFSEELKRLDQLSRQLQKNLPKPVNAQRLGEQYKPFQGSIDCMQPWPLPEDGSLRPLENWAQETMDFLDGFTNLAIASPHLVELNLAMAVMTAKAIERGSSLGTLALPAANGKLLLELAGKAPGPLVVPAIRLSLGSNPYEMGNEVQALLSGLSEQGTPVVFTGALGQLQAALNGGQGAVNDPLIPVVRHVPPQEIEPLVEFAVHWASRLVGGVPGSALGEIRKELLSVLASHAPGEQRRVLPILAARAVRSLKGGGRAAGCGSRAAAFSHAVAGLSETMGGLGIRPRAKRSPQVQDHFSKALTSPDLLQRLLSHLLGQDRALNDLFARLRMEALTRPAEQPLRLCLQGTPATGKSESAVLVARELGIPYVNIDAASMPDFHTAASQLLGSGRGIVMSHMPGRLEQVAKHNSGCVVEISDLDHAVPHVRAPLSDLFLQMMETGEAQSATGAMFSCANLILFFTMNLPGGADEDVRKGLGFGKGPSPEEVRTKVTKEIKQMLSGAFLSRVGRPILFDPLKKDALAEILERAVSSAITAAANRMGLVIKTEEPSKGLGVNLLSTMAGNVVSFGARAILEHGRSLAAEAFCRYLPTACRSRGTVLRVVLSKEGNLDLEERQAK